MTDKDRVSALEKPHLQTKESAAKINASRLDASPTDNTYANGGQQAGLFQEGNKRTADKAAAAKKAEKKEFFTAQNMVKLAVFTALSYVLYLFLKFPLPFMFPTWLDFQISDLPALLAGFMVGPVGGIVVIVMKCLMKMPFSSTACVGEVADIIVGIAFVLPAALIYKKHRSKKGALIGIVVGTACCVAASLIANAVVLIPFYVRYFFDGNEQIIVGMLQALFPSATWATFQYYYLPLSVLPFNLLRCVLSGALTFLLYKRLSRLFEALVPQKHPARH